MQRDQHFDVERGAVDLVLRQRPQTQVALPLCFAQVEVEIAGADRAQAVAFWRVLPWRRMEAVRVSKALTISMPSRLIASLKSGLLDDLDRSG